MLCCRVTLVSRGVASVDRGTGSTALALWELLAAGDAENDSEGWAELLSLPDSGPFLRKASEHTGPDESSRGGGGEVAGRRQGLLSFASAPFGARTSAPTTSTPGPAAGAEMHQVAGYDSEGSRPGAGHEAQMPLPATATCSRRPRPRPTKAKTSPFATLLVVQGEGPESRAKARTAARLIRATLRSTTRRVG